MWQGNQSIFDLKSPILTVAVASGFTPIITSMSLGVIGSKNAEGLNHTLPGRVNLFTTEKIEHWWLSLATFCFLDHEFSCVETVKYKFDSGTWYVWTFQQIYIYFPLSLCVFLHTC